MRGFWIQVQLQNFLLKQSVEASIYAENRKGQIFLSRVSADMDSVVF